MIKRHPELPAFIAGGAPEESAQRRARMYLYRDGGDIGYRLHGTLEPWSIGTDASSGCIRMFPEYVIDLYQRCPIGTAVQVLPHIADQAEKSNQPPDDRRACNEVRSRGPNARPLGSLARPLRAACCLAVGLADDDAACSSAVPRSTTERDVTNAEAPGFQNMQAGSEEDFILNVGRRTYLHPGLGRA